MVSAKIRAKMNSSERAALNPGRAIDLADVPCGDFSNLIVVCSRFRADIGSPQLAHDFLTSADLERDG